MAETSQDRVMRRQIVRSVLLFAAGFGISAALLHLVLPPPLGLYAAIRSEKLAMADQWAGRATSALFGSSHGHNGFDPRTFDSTLAANGLASTTLNLAVEGGSQSEQRAMALRFVRQLQPHPQQACFVMLELNAGANLTNDHLVHPRTINLYDWRTALLIARLSSPSLGLKRAAGRFTYAVLATTMYYANVGMLSNRIFAPPLDQSMIDDQTREDRRGLLLPYRAPFITERIARILAATPHTARPEPELLLPGNYDLLAEIQRASPVKNLQLVYWVSPMVRDVAAYPSFPSQINVNGVDYPIISAARPDLLPQLYQPEAWTDDAHLSGQGAAMLGQFVAQQLSLWYRSHPRSLACGG